MGLKGNENYNYLVQIWSFLGFFGPGFRKNKLLAQNNTFMSTSSLARVTSLKPFKPCMYVKLSGM